MAGGGCPGDAAVIQWPGRCAPTVPQSHGRDACPAKPCPPLSKRRSCERSADFDEPALASRRCPTICAMICCEAWMNFCLIAGFDAILRHQLFRIGIILWHAGG